VGRKKSLKIKKRGSSNSQQNDLGAHSESPGVFEKSGEASAWGGERLSEEARFPSIKENQAGKTALEEKQLLNCGAVRGI